VIDDTLEVEKCISVTNIKHGVEFCDQHHSGTADCSQYRQTAGAIAEAVMLALGRRLFQFDHFAAPVFAARTLEVAESKTWLIWRNASKPQRRSAFRASWAHNGCTISKACEKGGH